MGVVAFGQSNLFVSPGQLERANIPVGGRLRYVPLLRPPGRRAGAATGPSCYPTLIRNW
jgi:hypothetical protein